MTKTLCRCCTCGLEIENNAEWKAESAMNDHVKDKHPTEYAKFQEITQQIHEEIAELWKKRKPLYMTTVKGETHEGKWNY